MTEYVTLFSSIITLNVWIAILFIGGIKDLKSVRFKKKRIRLYWLFVVTFFAGVSLTHIILIFTLNNYSLAFNPY